MKSNLFTNLTVGLIVGVAGFGLISGGLQLEKWVLTVDKTTVQEQVIGTMTKVYSTSKTSRTKYLVTLSNGVVVEVADLWSIGQNEAVAFFSGFQNAQGKDCLVKVTYAGFDNPWLSIHPYAIMRESNLTCEVPNEPKN